MSNKTKSKSKIRQRICITDWALDVQYINPRDSYLEELIDESVIITNEDLPKELSEKIEQFLLNEYEPKMVGRNQNKW